MTVGFFSILWTRLLKRLQRVIVVDGTIHSQKDGVEDNEGSFKGAEATLCGAQLVLWFSVLTILVLDEMNDTL